MEKCTTNIKAINQLFQVLDGSFPSGSFVHSFGLEPHITKGNVTTIKELKVFLQNLIKYQYSGADFSFVRRVYRYLNSQNLTLLSKEDNNYSAMMSYEYAKASKELGANYLKQIAPQIKKPIVQEYYKLVKSEKSDGNELAVLSAFAYDLDLEVEFFLSLWCKKKYFKYSYD